MSIDTSERTDRAYEAGSIWYTSWGYDQTNVEFFKVVAATPGTVTLRRIASTFADGREYPVPERAITDFGLIGNATMYDRETGEWVPNPLYVRDKERGYSEKQCRKPRGNYTSLKISESRRAWPYDGGGAYSTDAAGGAGH